MRMWPSGLETLDHSAIGAAVYQCVQIPSREEHKFVSSYIYIAHIVYAPCGPLIGELINLWLMTYIYIYILLKLNILANRRGRDRMVVGFTTTSAISGYHHWCCEFESRSRRGVEHYVIKFVSDLRQVGVFLCVLRFLQPIITDRHDIVKILLKVAFNTIKPNHLG
jgi:hypothetical protein